MHFEIYVKKTGIQTTASPGSDTVHQLLAVRQNDLLLSPEKNPQYGELGKFKGGSEITTICYQLNAEVIHDEDLVISVLLANIAKGNESHMRAMLAILEGRVRHHQIVRPGGSSTYGLSVPKTDAEIDRLGARMVEKIGDELARAMNHTADHFRKSCQNHDCILLYDTVNVQHPAQWAVGESKEIRGLMGVPMVAQKGNPRYMVDLVIVRQA